MSNLTKTIAVLSALASVVMGWVFVDDRFAHATDVRLAMQLLDADSQLRMVQYRLRDVTAELSAIAVKEQHGLASKYDKSRKEALEREQERLYLDERELQKAKAR